MSTAFTYTNRRGAATLTVGCVLWFCLCLSASAEPPIQVAPDPDAAAQRAAPVVEQAPIPTRNLLDAVRDGGPLMIPLAICSFALLVFGFERAISLRRGRVIPRPFVKRFLHQLEEGLLNREDSLRLCAENRSPVAEVFAAAAHKWGKPSVEVEQAVIDSGERVTNGLRKYLRVFSGISTISPLLGLLGTVLGMIKVFAEIMTQGTGNASVLAGGISEALITTAAGLTVAIPALVMHRYFTGRIDGIVVELEQETIKLVDALHSEENTEAAL